MNSLKSNFQFRAVYDSGHSVGGKYIVLFCMENSLGINRLGITVSKKVGNSVVRNRARRVIRESYRLMEMGCAQKYAQGYDFIVLARKPVVTVGLVDVMAELLRLVKKLQL